MCFTRVGFGLTRKYETRQERLDREKQPTLEQAPEGSFICVRFGFTQKY